MDQPFTAAPSYVNIKTSNYGMDINVIQSPNADRNRTRKNCQKIQSNVKAEVAVALCTQETVYKKPLPPEAAQQSMKLESLLSNTIKKGTPRENFQPTNF
ncbi:hypothetical protein RvY_10277 [Ramazzottius varieornatus]|uniref:Uncharacterized protein n=1 Tax=Ramazzottius varieornatus TaxID=947166 RepID=A0A1D1VHM3_RAMVA|nr:hypothetical protein RvY_10277 [Ramazzottius varieornatus]